MSKWIDITGKEFGQLLVVKKVGKNKHGKLMWLCRCTCGEEKLIAGSDLKNDKTKSCGCSRILHGHAKKGGNSKVYRVWCDMIQRCTNSSHHAYRNYGGRGISVCARWLRFENFLIDMGDPPTPCHQIDRINNDDGYYVTNCHWVTSKMNNQNRRNNRVITFGDKTQCLSEWARDTGISHQAILWRLNHGWSVEQALTEPAGKRSCKGIP